MGKKSSQASLKTSKNDKRELNSLIKVLRPKVYITDSSSFKSLVQELTGNRSPASSPPPSIPQHVEHIPVLDMEDHGYQESSVELSADSSEPSMQMPFTSFDSSTGLSMPTPFSAYESTFSSHHMDFSQYLSTIDSWILDTDNRHYNCGGGYTPNNHQEVCIYDYDLSGLM